MTTRKLFPLLFVAIAAAALLPERASAQVCWYCGDCPFGSGEMCYGYSFHDEPILGYLNCGHPEFCRCERSNPGLCWVIELGMDEGAEQEQLDETLAAIKAGRSIPADGPFFYVSSGRDLVVRRKCDAEEVARLAAAEVDPVLALDD